MAMIPPAVVEATTVILEVVVMDIWGSQQAARSDVGNQAIVNINPAIEEALEAEAVRVLAAATAVVE
jgi:hypothetical protein